VARFTVLLSNVRAPVPKRDGKVSDAHEAAVIGDFVAGPGEGHALETSSDSSGFTDIVQENIERNAQVVAFIDEAPMARRLQL
jgi:hypothetical protein